MSPDWYVSPDQVPTWLYQAVHLTGTVRAMSDDELAEQIETLSAKFEDRLLPKKPWLSSKMTAGRLDAMKKAIVGLVMTVEEVEGSFKLNQHKSETDYAAIAGALASQADAGAQQIAQLMRSRHGRKPLPTKRTSSKGPCHDPHRQPPAAKPPAASTKPAVFVDGASGTTGLGIQERLRLQNDVAVKSIAEEKRKDAGAKRALMEEVDLVILCLPDDAAKETVALIDSMGAEAPKVLDASTAFRVAPDWAYGFAELTPDQADKIRAARKVSNPGCYPTGGIALLRPLVDAGLLPCGLSRHDQRGERLFGRRQVDDRELRGWQRAVVRTVRPRLRAQASAGNAALLKADAAADLRAVGRQLPAGHAGVGAAASRHADRQTQRSRPARRAGQALRREQIRLGDAARKRGDQGREAGAEALNETNMLELYVFASEKHRQAVLVARLDNLGKGASGAAVQNMRLMLGWPT